jgi:spore germination protein KB
MFFLGDEVSNTQDFKKNTKYIISKITFFNVFVILATVGVFGSTLTKQFNLPFFMFLKNIKLLDIIERVESIFMSFWFITDATIIIIFVYIITKLIKKVGNLEYSRTSVTPIIFGSFIFSFYVVSSTFELYEFSEKFLLYINLGYQFVLPIIALIVGKIRKVI